MISLSITTYDEDGNVILDHGESELALLEPRVSRAGTLDGGAVITHSGLSQGDRTFRISTVIDAEQKRLIDYITSNAVKIGIACREGYFLGAVKSSDTSTYDLIMTILIESKEA